MQPTAHVQDKMEQISINCLLVPCYSLFVIWNAYIINAELFRTTVSDIVFRIIFMKKCRNLFFYVLDSPDLHNEVKNHFKYEHIWKQKTFESKSCTDFIFQ